jgi:hypothetical protein
VKDEILARVPESIASGAAAAKRRIKKRAGPVKSTKKSAAAKNKKKTEEPATPGVLRLRGQKGKYQISDITGKLAERQNVTLHVGWNVQPWVGALWWAPATGAVPRTAGTIVPSEAFDFPALKGTKKAAAEAKAQESA